MSSAVPYLVIGIAGGASYALLALGLVLINKSSRILSFAHGEIGGFATFAVAALTTGRGWPWPLAVATGLTIGAAVGLASQFLLSPSERFGRLPLLVGTIAILSLLVVLETRWFGASRTFGPPIHGWITLPPFLGSTSVTYLQLLTIGTVVVVCALLWFVLERTAMGLRVRAVADDRPAARAVGLDPRRVEAFTWTIAGALAALAGVFLGWTAQTVSPGFLSVYLLGAFAAAIMGGVDSMPGAVLGGLIVGIAESFTRRYWGQTPGSPDAVIFALLFAVLLVRPTGLFTRRAARTAASSEALVALHPLVAAPAPSTRLRVRRAGPILAASIVVVVVCARVSDTTAYRLSLIPIIAIVALSLNTLIAGTGEVSLGQAALMGLGGFAAAVSASSWNAPFAVAVLVGTLTSCLAAGVLGLAALRVRGLHLAILTMGFAIVLESFLFPMNFLSKGGAGILLDRPTFAGFDLANDRTFLFFVLAVLALVWWCDYRLFAAPIGRAWVALRDNELAASARGLNARGLRVLAFMFSGAAAGLAGALFGYRQGVLAPTQFPFLLSVTFLLYVVIGGIGVRGGVVAAAGIATWFTTTSSGPSLSSQMILLVGSAGAIFAIGRHPEGIGGRVRALITKRQRASRVAASEVRLPAERTAPIAPAAAGVAPLVTSAAAGAVTGRVPRGPSNGGETLLEVRNLRVHFDGLVALQDVSLRVRAGEIVAVVGPNGAGKTTLFNTISGFVAPADGTVRFQDEPLDGLPPAQRAARGLGRTFQQGGLWSSETAKTNLLIAQHLTVDPRSPRSMLAIGGRQRYRERSRRLIADEVLDILGLGADADRPVSELNYGHRRVLELGCALIARPAVLMLDEPAAGLNIGECAWLAGVITSIQEELDIAVLLIEHHVPLVRRVADVAYVLDMGQQICVGTPREIAVDPRVIEAYLGTTAVHQPLDVGAGR